MVLDPGSIDIDITRLRQWTGRFNPKPNFRYYCDRERRADAARIKKALRSTRGHPTLIYIAGHTVSLDHNSPAESPCDILAFAPADYLHSGKPEPIPYAMMRQTLLKGSQSGSLLLIIGFGPSLVHHRGLLLWQLPANLGSQTWLEVHIAATAPGESAASFTTGAVFTQALYNIDPIQTLSLKQIAKRLQ
ncbi:unnamed protein product [Rhizoctonia solani]|uniref:Uncharacterized protein n=1 Tax=Rhizoctonia solani TaxID=456999 RepID=A0A8H3CUF8_9AGAM|nr:unnamed protein product [Rhizoctonia solani]